MEKLSSLDRLSWFELDFSFSFILWKLLFMLRNSLPIYSSASSLIVSSFRPKIGLGKGSLLPKIGLGLFTSNCWRTERLEYLNIRLLYVGFWLQNFVLLSMFLEDQLFNTSWQSNGITYFCIVLVVAKKCHYGSIFTAKFIRTVTDFKQI